MKINSIKSLFPSEALIAKIYFTKIPSSAQALDSLLHQRNAPTKFLYPHKTTSFML